MKRMTAISVMLATLLWLSSAGSLAQSPAAPVTVVFEAPAHVVLNEAVVLSLTIRNRSTEPIAFDLGRDRKENLEIQLTGPDGVTRSLPRWTLGGVGGIYRIGKVSLPPGEDLTEQYVLSEWTSLGQPGAYKIQVTVDSEFRMADGTLVNPLRSQPLEVTVGGRDAGSLREVCDRLTKRAIENPNAQAGWDAARALSYVVDPVAIPYLEAVARATNSHDQVIVEGLIRIGTPLARAVLDGMAASADKRRSVLSRGALQRFKLR